MQIHCYALPVDISDSLYTTILLKNYPRLLFLVIYFPRYIILQFFHPLTIFIRKTSGIS
jgi:hypothetical protein